MYRCPVGEKLKCHYTNEEDGQQLRRYWTNACCDTLFAAPAHDRLWHQLEAEKCAAKVG
jgi:hypothetical protein